MFIVKSSNGYSLRQEDVDIYFAYLNKMRDDGSINMFGAAKEIQDLTEGSLDEAIWIVELWMKFTETGQLAGAM
tara:strand:+ start:231 stop:452 length:222 start_codon:yes stop_codon:yes gene_type:complete